ncbi:MAG TPA: 50S ribosomal protein L21 [Deltaproteobacteria bacterium]|nr:50S ribosomal protein L21 [Deltaproteobacteria bacterium]
MYAVIKTGGKQYKVTRGDVLRVEKLAAEVGSTVELGEVYAVGDGEELKIGRPTVEGARVTARVLGHGKAGKIIVFKKKRRKGYTRKQGHRQLYTSIKIDEITA